MNGTHAADPTQRQRSLMRFLLEMTTTQRRVILAVSLVAVFAIGYANQIAETLLQVEVEVLFLAPISAVAWAYPRRFSLLFASYAAVVATFSCVIMDGFPLVPMIFEFTLHTGTFLSAALVVNLLAQAMGRQTHRAYFDALTESVNAERFREFVDREMSRSKRHERPLSLAFIDIDNFKRINDEHGHSAGDRALHSLAALMRHQVRGFDTVGRLGGDEFGILMPETDEAEAYAVLERLKTRVAEQAAEEGWPVSASIGAVTVQPAACCDVTAAMIIERADAAMYRVKAKGKNGVEIEMFE